MLRERICKHRLERNISDTTDIPIGSSRVENHTTWDGLEILGLQRKIDRMARSP
jgi:hypothetical protein